MTSGKWLWRLILLFILFDEMKTSAELLRMIFICQWYGRTTTSFVQIIIITLNFKKDLVRYLHGTANKHQLDLYFIGGCLVVAFLVLDPGLFLSVQVFRFWVDFKEVEVKVKVFLWR